MVIVGPVLAVKRRQELGRSEPPISFQCRG